MKIPNLFLSVALLLASITGLAQTATFNSVRLTAPITITNQAATKAYVDSAAGTSWRTVGNVNVAVTTNDINIAIVTNYTSNRTWTLPSASSVPSGRTIRIYDFTGSLGKTASSTNYVQLFRAGADTINGAAAVTWGSPLAMGTLVSDGVSAWTFNLLGSSTRSAIGLEASATGTTASAFGNGATASGLNSIASGFNAWASSSRAIAIGSSSVASAQDSIVIGSSALGTSASSVTIGNSSSNVQGASVVIGAFATNIQSGDVVIGSGATRPVTTSGFGGASVTIGQNARSEDGRVVNIGEQNRVEPVSSTAIGRGIRIGSGSGNAHAMALGRGSYIPDQVQNYVAGTNGINGNHTALSWGNANTGGNKWTSGTHLWIGAGFRHAYVDYPDNATVRLVPLPSVFIHAWDARDDTASPTNDIAGGDLFILGGSGTGTATGGSIKLQTAPAGAVSSNTKNAPVSALELDANTTAGETRLLLFDITAGTLQRVSIGAADSGGTGFRVLRIPN